MLELFFYSTEIVHMEFIPEGVTVNKHRCKEILCHLCSSIHRKRPDLWRRKNWLLLHDKSPAHRSVLVQEKLAKQEVTILPQSLYSPDLHHVISDTSNCGKLLVFICICIRMNSKKTLFCEPLNETAKTLENMAMRNMFIYSNSLKSAHVEAICTLGVQIMLGKHSGSMAIIEQTSSSYFIHFVCLVSLHGDQIKFPMMPSNTQQLSSLSLPLHVSVCVQEQGGPVISPGTGYPLCHLLRLSGLRWRYSDPPRIASIRKSLFHISPHVLIIHIRWIDCIINGVK
jgi:hypothetical protein